MFGPRVSSKSTRIYPGLFFNFLPMNKKILIQEHPLHALATVSVGHLVPIDGSANDPNGPTRVIEASRFMRDGFLLDQFLERIHPVAASSCLQSGDLICWASRHTSHTSLITGYTEPTVCAAPLLQIRPLPAQAILPEYLFWYLNMPIIRQRIHRLAGQATRTALRLIESRSVYLDGILYQYARGGADKKAE
jgi:hypothetical protein